MKKFMKSMMMLMVMATAMSLVSCSDDIADSITKALIDEPTIRGTWSNYVDENTPERTIRFLQLHRTDNKTTELTLAEVQNGTRFISRGEWKLSKDCKVLTLIFKNGARANQTITCDVVDSKYSYLSINFEGKVYSFNEVKSKELDQYLNSI